jgi:hypothetical protein
MTELISAGAIEAEYRRLGHRLGWRFLYGPERTLQTAEVAVISLNPGGSAYEPPSWSCEDGSAYLRESWKGRPAGMESHQTQIRRMLALLGSSPDEVLAGPFVPFRSRNWGELASKQASVSFGRRLWKWALAGSQISTIVVVGRAGGLEENVCEVADCTTLMQEMPAGWGKLTLRKFANKTGRVIISIPHVSQFKLFGRSASDHAFAELIKRSPTKSQSFHGSPRNSES